MRHSTTTYHRRGSASLSVTSDGNPYTMRVVWYGGVLNNSQP